MVRAFGFRCDQGRERRTSWGREWGPEIDVAIFCRGICRATSMQCYINRHLHYPDVLSGEMSVCSG